MPVTSLARWGTPDAHARPTVAREAQCAAPDHRDRLPLALTADSEGYRGSEEAAYAATRPRRRHRALKEFPSCNKGPIKAWEVRGTKAYRAPKLPPRRRLETLR